MPSTYDPLLRLELQATGENATTWGVKTNTNLELLAESVAGAVTLNVAGSGDYTLSTANGADDEARQAILVLTGLLTGNRNIIVPASPKNYTVINNTTGAFTVTLKQSGGSGVVIPTTGPSITVCTSTTCVDSIGATPYTKSFLAATSATAAQAVLGSPIPAGAIMEYGGSAAPAGWLLCDGTAVSRTTYADLFAVIGTAYGVGDNSTTFNLPDRRDRFGIGASGTVARGSTGGSTTSGGTALTTAQLPSHTHTGTTSTSGAHTHTVLTYGGAAADANTISAGRADFGTVDNVATSSAGAHNHTFTTDATGSGQTHTHTVTPPYVASNYIIKT